MLLVLPGLIGLALFHDQLGDPSQWSEGVANRVLPLLVVNLLPTGVLGIVVGAFMAGVVANLDSYINSASTLVVTDLYQPLVPGRTDTHYLRVGQALVVVFLLAGIAFARMIQPVFGSVFEAFQTFMTFFQGPLLALLLLGMLTRRATSPGALAGMLLGVGTAVVLHSARFVLGPRVRRVLSLGRLVVLRGRDGGDRGRQSFTRPYDEERLRGLVCWIPVREESPS